MATPKKPKKRKPKVLALSVALDDALYEKIHRIARNEDRSASAVVRRLIAALPEPASEVA